MDEARNRALAVGHEQRGRNWRGVHLLCGPVCGGVDGEELLTFFWSFSSVCLNCWLRGVFRYTGQRRDYLFFVCIRL